MKVLGIIQIKITLNQKINKSVSKIALRAINKNKIF